MEVVLVRDREASVADPVRARPRPAAELWKRLPLPLTKWLGPALIRWLPLH